MKQLLFTMALMLVITPSAALAATNTDKLMRSAPVICEGKASAEAYVKTLSDYELVRGITNIMSDARTSNLRSAHELNQWLQDQSDCSVWAEGTYLIEVKWLYHEAAARGLTTTINKIGQGLLRWNPINERFEERQDNNNRWVPWNAHQK